MLRVAICDDNREDIDRIRRLAVGFSDTHPQTPVDVRAYRLAYDLLEEVGKTGGFDIYLLDVVMPHMTGVDLARRIRARKERAEILFLTVSREYAVEAFDVKAARYLIKPVRQADFDRALLECLGRLSPQGAPALMLKLKDGLQRVPLRELVCIESFNHNQVCTLSDGSVLETAATLSELMAQLGSCPAFVRPHRAYIVNMDYIRKLSGHELLLTNGRRIPVPQNGYGRLKETYLAYMTRT